MKLAKATSCLMLVALGGLARAQPSNVTPEGSFSERLGGIEADVDMIKEAVNEPEGAIQTTISDVKKLKKVKVSGYVQARYEYDQSAADGANKNAFNVRRARLKVAAQPTDKTALTLQIDLGGGSEEKSVATKDAYLEYFFRADPFKGPTLTAGQTKWPFGYQVVQSSSVRETPERARVIRTLFPGERDRGVKYSTAQDGRVFWEAGVFNGTGANTSDNNNEKDLVGRARCRFSDNLDAGISWYIGEALVSTDPTVEHDKTRYGADFQYYLQNTSLKAEYVTGKDLGFHKWGWWAQIAHNFTPRDTGVVMYDVFDDPASSRGKLDSWNVGWVHWLDDTTRLKLFYEFNCEERDEIDNDTLRVELISLF